jgi:hypothetical protein
LVGIVVLRTLEGAVVAYLVAGSTAGCTTATPADVVAALGTVAAGWAIGDTILAGSTALGKLVDAFPLGIGDPDSGWGARLVPVASPSFANKVIVSARSNLHVLVSALNSLILGSPSKLGVDIGLWCEGVGFVTVAAGSIVMTMA